MKSASFTIKHPTASRQLIVALVLVSVATAANAASVLFVDTSHSGDTNFNTLITETGQEIALTPGSHIEFPTQHVLWSRHEFYPGGNDYQARFWGSFVIYAGVFGLPANTAVVSGNGFTDYEYVEGRAAGGNTWWESELFGTVLSVNPVLLANLGYSTQLTGGSIYVQTGSEANAYAPVTFGPAPVPEPCTMYLIGAACLALGVRLCSRA